MQIKTRTNLHAHVIDNAIVPIPQGSHEKLVPEGGAVGSVIEEAHRHVGPLQNAGANLRHFGA
jgi:hypothetical protein